jgi:hypothetical protein
MVLIFLKATGVVTLLQHYSRRIKLAETLKALGQCIQSDGLRALNGLSLGAAAHAEHPQDSINSAPTLAAWARLFLDSS